jgi:hypothetical protein
MKYVTKYMLMFQLQNAFFFIRKLLQDDYYSHAVGRRHKLLTEIPIIGMIYDYIN